MKMNKTHQGWIGSPVPYLQVHSHRHGVPTSRGLDLMQESLGVLPGILRVHQCRCQAQSPQYLQNKISTVKVVSQIVVHSEGHVRELGPMPWKWPQLACSAVSTQLELGQGRRQSTFVAIGSGENKLFCSVDAALYSIK